MRAATEGNLPPVMPEGNLVEVLGCEVRQGLPGELMVESSPSCQRRTPCETSKEMSNQAADAAAHTYLLTTWKKALLIEFYARGLVQSRPKIIKKEARRIEYQCKAYATCGSRAAP